MRFRIRGSAAATLVVLLGLGLLAIAACSKKSNPASPGGGGGGGSAEVFNSGIFAPVAAVFVHTFPNTGDFGYHCLVHGVGMSGTIHVVAGTADSAFVSIVDNAYSPASQTVHQGGYIKWTKATGTSHSVTSN